jgi:hypothetical protein
MSERKYVLHLRLPDKRLYDLFKTLALSLECEVDWETASVCRAVLASSVCKHDDSHTGQWGMDRHRSLEWLDEIIDAGTEEE